MKLIIYTNENDKLSILTPASECGLPIEEVARKDVPAGVPYQIVDETDIPTDREFRNAWEANIIPDGVGIGADAWFAEQAELKAQEEANKQEVEYDNN
jgi:hypothetical protein